MKFDNAHKPNRDNLSEVVAKQMDAVFYARRAQGLNVQFVSASGKLDEWSFANAEQRDAFTAKLSADGKDYAVSA